MANCASCKYVVGGECRRFPPQVSIIPLPTRGPLGNASISPQPVATFPPVEPDLWCGEWATNLLA